MMETTAKPFEDFLNDGNGKLLKIPPMKAITVTHHSPCKASFEGNQVNQDTR